jgi:PEGA domain-containing protein
MNLVLALEPDASQAAPLTSLVRRKLGANLTIVPTMQAAIVAMNQRLPDVLLFGRNVPQAERDQAAAHLTSLSGGAGVRTLEIANLSEPRAQEQAAYDIRMSLASAEKDRVSAMATLISAAHDQSELAGWNHFPSESTEPHVPKGAIQEHPHVEAEIDRRVQSDVERLRREADEQLATELRHFHEESSLPRTAQPDTNAAPLLRSTHDVWWRIAAIVALIAFLIALGVLLLPNAVSTAARSSTALVGTAQDAAKVAKQAVAAAPEVTRSALTAAESVLPHITIVTAPAPAPTLASPAAAPAPRAEDKPAPITGPGFLTAFSRIPMEVYSDGRRIGTTEDGQLLIASGTHQIEFVSERFHYRAVASLTIPPGHVLPYTVALPSAEVHITTTPGAEIWIEGERIGVAPLEQIYVPIGTREIVVRDSDGAEKRQVVEVKLGETVELSLTPETAIGDSSPATPRLAPLSR